MGDPILIDEKTSADAAIKIQEHINRACVQGWMSSGGGAFALIDGWRNEYRLTREGQSKILAFDLRPTLRYVSKLELTLATLVLPLASGSNQVFLGMPKIPNEEEHREPVLSNFSKWLLTILIVIMVPLVFYLISVWRIRNGSM